MIATVLVSMLFIFSPAIAFAEEPTSNLAVEPILPESQIGDITNYFNLNLDVGAEETLGLRIRNTSQEEIEVAISSHTAYTNVNGVAEHARETDDVNSTLQQHLGEHLIVPDIITLAPGETKEEYVTLIMPDESFTGLLAGGLRIREVEKEDENAAEGVAIKNTFSYVIAVVVSNERTSTTPELELLNVFPDQLNYRNVISATIQNYTPTYVNQLEVEAEVRLEGEEDILYQVHRENMQMAPNSHFNFPISLNGDRFRGGDYVLTMTARSGDHEWSWEEPFTIESEAARNLNREDVTIDTSINWWLVAIIVVVILLIIIIIYLISKQKKIVKLIEKESSSQDANSQESKTLE